MNTEDVTLRLLKLLGSYRPAVVPQSSDPAALKQFLKTVAANAVATKQFCDLTLPDAEADHELHASLAEARLASLAINRALARAGSLEGSKKRLDKIRIQYDNFSASVSHVVLLLDRGLVAKIYL